ncbi:MAG: aminotransferase class V-fold PLP-dependent enzyme [Oscillospiraceae bacterium]|nr:aminotransferase class V-fold PLP-dependent enzyme [Oscillospiraceae bacterium]
MAIVNFDNSATSFPKPASVKDAALSAIADCGGNPGRSGHKLSIQAAAHVFNVRSRAAHFFGAQVDNVVFTLNCTHALNLAIQGVMRRYKTGHIIISNLEHNSVARPVHALSKCCRYNYSIARVSHDDDETIRNIKSLITPKTRLVVFSLGSNVTGQITPFRKIGALCNERGICFIGDGAQVCGVLPVTLGDGINILCTSGHKSLYGLTGTGLLITDGKHHIAPVMQGGTGSTSLELIQPDFTPDSLESGTVNTVGIIALGEGLRFIETVGLNNIRRHETALCERFLQGASKIPKIKVYRNDRVKDYLPVISFNLYGKTANEAASLLSDSGFALRGGLHCSGLAHKSIGTQIDGTVRFSPSFFNNEREVDALLGILEKAARE